MTDRDGGEFEGGSMTTRNYERNFEDMREPHKSIDEIIDNRDLMRNRAREVCRACGSTIVHTQNYGGSTPKCVAYLLERIRKLERT